MKVLLVDDDPFLSKSVVRLLSESGYDVHHVACAADAWTSIEREQPSLALLDLGLPDQDGITLCRRIRARWMFPILMLTSKSQAIDKVLGLESGADDYLPKPFDAHELVARIRALLRRAQDYAPSKKSQITHVGGFELDDESRTIRYDSQMLELTDTEYRILHYLGSNAGRAISREQLFETIWGYEIEFNSNSLEVLIYRLRGKLSKAGADQNIIRTLRGYGYKWETG